MEIEKTPIQELTGDQLDSIKDFAKTDVFFLLSKIAEDEKYKRYKEEFLVAPNMDTINFVRGVNTGIDFIMDVVNRAKEELVRRQGEIDNDDELK